MNSDIILELKDVWKTYHPASGEHVQALRGVSITIQTGKFTVIVGPSGSGKSTLLKVAGLLESPSQGFVVFKGTYTSNLSANERASIIKDDLGFIVPYPNLLPYLTLQENVKLPMIDPDNEKVRDTLREVGITYQNKYPHEMTLKDQQRVALAKALINEPSLILADEPTGELDSHSTKKFLDLIKKLKDNLTVIIATNNDMLANYADNLFYIRDGILETK